MHGCFPKRPAIFQIYIKIGVLGYQICCGSKNFAFGLTAGKIGKFGLKVLFVSCAFIVRVAGAPADHESTNEQDFRGCSCDDKPVFIDRKSTSKTQVFKTEEFSIDFIRRS